MLFGAQDCAHERWCNYSIVPKKHSSYGNFQFQVYLTAVLVSTWSALSLSVHTMHDQRITMSILVHSKSQNEKVLEISVHSGTVLYILGRPWPALFWSAH
jgi:hypothetical protein